MTPTPRSSAAPTRADAARRGRVACITLGCPKNLVDSETMLGLLHRSGYVMTSDLAEADGAIVNTCSFIEPARQESIDTILEVARHKRAGGLRWVVVAGCLAQRYGAELLAELPEIDGVIGTGALGSITTVVGDLMAGGSRRLEVGAPGAPVRDFGARVLSTPPHYAYLKIAEGCDHQCAFCIIPVLRGPMRSRPVEELVVEAGELVASGVRELNLISQDTTAYGSDLPGGRRELPRLLAALDRLPELQWIRLLYTHPALWTDDLMDAVAGLERVVPYADVPIQHITDAMMKRMNRGISGRRVRAVLRRLRERVPGIALRTTVIVGHPGETESDLEALIDFLEEFRFERLGVFPYSREQGTPAGEDADQLAGAVVDERVERVAALAKRLALEIHSERLGRTEDVMIDGPPGESGRIPARSSWDAPEIDGTVWVRGIEAAAGAMVPVRITATGPHDVLAEPVRSTAAHRLGTSVDVVRSPALGSGAGRADGVRAVSAPARGDRRIQELGG